MTWLVGIDVGGTFTDFYALEGQTGAVCLFKRPSTPANPAEAIVAGLAEMMAEFGIEAGEVSRLSHGTTVGTNALIQRRGGAVALVTTRGFRDLLEIGRQTRPHMYSLQEDHPDPLVPRERRIECAERVLADGTPLEAPGPDAIAAAVDAVLATGPEAVAVCFLFAHVNPEHERRVGEAIARVAPDVHLSLSSEVHPEFREYERFSTAALNAYLQPVMSRYLGYLEQSLARDVPGVDVGIYQSSGGLMSVDTARRFPVRTALSGPAAGAVGAIHAARLASAPDVITLDMGGTSADVSLVRDYEAGVGFDRSVAGFPVRLPMVDIHTVGAGGGSVAWFDRDGLLKVGPTSAGADPGPACYGRGGTEPTVTDANFVLGRLSPDGLAGGRMGLDPDLARAAFVPAADRLGFSVERTAHGVLGIVAANMVRAIRTVTVEKGHDPRGYALMAFGGAGPLHASDVARSLGVTEVIVPFAPGILCAQGLVVSDLKEDFVHSERLPLARRATGALADAVERLAGRAAAWFEAEGVAADRRTLAVSLDMRYAGQNFELRVDLPPASTAPEVPPPATLAEMFFDVHTRHYGYHNPDDPVEVVNVRLTARGGLEHAAAARVAVPGRAAAPAATRPVHFASGIPVETPIFARGDLGPGTRIEGPAVIEQLDATTVIHPGDRLRVDDGLNIVIEVTP